MEDIVRNDFRTYYVPKEVEEGWRTTFNLSKCSKNHPCPSIPSADVHQDKQRKNGVLRKQYPSHTQLAAIKSLNPQVAHPVHLA
jgi:hypothetical protein